MKEIKSYQNYQFARDMAWDILLQYHIQTLPISVQQLCQSMHIYVYHYTQAARLLHTPAFARHARTNEGFTTIINGHHVIFYDETVHPYGRLRFTVAHELGHIVCGHLNPDALSNAATVQDQNILTVWNRGEHKEPNPFETAANIFASRLLAPACVLMELKIHTAQELQAVTGLSLTAAQYRLKRLNLLRERGKFYTSKKERQVRELFDPFIRSFHSQKERAFASQILYPTIAEKSDTPLS